ncbi:MAG: ClpXP protease specificity-enhancing factor [Herminiimonas sp.]|nr:ClpXP protease specificity-enhancing factor [Herminiimonas sp.]
MSETSTKPYLLRAIYEWCTDNGYTPYLAAMADGSARVPKEFVKNGEIVLNISFGATSGLKMDNDVIHFNARFGGISREISVPIENVVAIYARENGQGMAFEVSRLPARDHVPVAEASLAEDARPESHAPALSSVPTHAGVDEKNGAPSDEPPEPPKKGGKPFLTRVK